LSRLIGGLFAYSTAPESAREEGARYRAQEPWLIAVTGHTDREEREAREAGEIELASGADGRDG
jgi:hypothetical protein